ncbi:MAG: PaaI family thioesterase [Tissierellia bacterium]|nr:PaaI family thioesterase [Tissierellia bacterium]
MQVKKFLEKIGNLNSYAVEAGIVLTNIEKEKAEGELVITKDNMNIVGSVHGAVMFNLCDTLSNYAAYTTGNFVTSVSGDINFLNAAMDTTKLFCRAEVVKSGGKIIVCRAEVYDDNDTIIAISTQTYARLKDKLDLDFD